MACGERVAHAPENRSHASPNREVQDMNLQDLISNPQVLDQLARSAGVDRSAAQTGLEALLPAVTKGLQRNSRDASGLESLAKALGSGAHDRYLDQPETLADPRARMDGNAILGHIFGSKDVSRNVAGHAAQTTGLDPAILKQLLPVVASIAMGALSKRSQGGTALREPAARPGPAASGGADLLGSLLGGLMGQASGGRNPENDSALDDLLDMAKKFL